MSSWANSGGVSVPFGAGRPVEIGTSTTWAAVALSVERRSDGVYNVATDGLIPANGSAR